MSIKIPQSVLSQALSEKIDGRRVRTAAFTTFSFDPGFFEQHVLTLLFDQNFHQSDKLRSVQLEDALRQLDHLDVYYDAQALSQNASPPLLDYGRYAIHRDNGCFHPKLVLLLIDNPETEAGEVHQSLIFGVMSANLTRSGWWENVECVHFDEFNAMDDTIYCSYRQDLLDLLKYLQNDTDRQSEALNTVREFVKANIDPWKPAQVSNKGKYHTRLFWGQAKMGFADWLDQFRLQEKHQWHLEVIAPFVDKAADTLLEGILQSVKPIETRIYTPVNFDGAVVVSSDTYEAVIALGEDSAIGCRVLWASMPGEVINRGRDEQANTIPPRYVHAKVYRLWSKERGEVLIVGSVNFTRAAQGRASAGNFETAMLIHTDVARPSWWLQVENERPESFVEAAANETDGYESVFADIRLRFDWATMKAEYCVCEKNAGFSFGIKTLSGLALIKIAKSDSNVWVGLPDEACSIMTGYLQAGAFFRIEHEKGSWKVLVEELNTPQKPSLLTQLTAQEILQYWALLTADQRATFLDLNLKIAEEGVLILANKSERLESKDTMFDQFAGIFHSFACLSRFVIDAIENGRFKEAEVRLIGRKYDSLPSLLQKVIDSDMSSVNQYITFLSAKQLYDKVMGRYPEFGAFAEGRDKHLVEQLAGINKLRIAIGHIDADDEAFFSWYEEQFLFEAEVSDVDVGITGKAVGASA